MPLRNTMNLMETVCLCLKSSVCFHYFFVEDTEVGKKNMAGLRYEKQTGFV